MKNNILNKYTYEYNYAPENYRRSNMKYNNHNYEDRIIDIENDSLRKEYDEKYSNNKNLFLMNEITKLKNKYLLAKEKLDLAKNQKEKDDKYIQNLENQLILKYQNQKNLDNLKIKKIPKNTINLYNKNNINKQRVKGDKSRISDFYPFEAKNNKSFQKRNKNVKINNNKNLNKVQIKDNTPLKDNQHKINMKRNNSTIFTSSLLNNDGTNKKKKKIINEKMRNYINDNYYNLNQDNFIDKNKLIIRNCDCIINLNPDNIESNNIIKNLLANENKNKAKNNLSNIKVEEKKIIQERYLIIDENHKPIYIKGKQILGMNLMPLINEDNEIISDNENNIFFYDLDGRLHNQQDLEKIILENGIPLVNEKNMPILGINNIPIIDKYGDFIYRRKHLIDEYNNYIKGKYADLLRDNEGKPIKILIEKKMYNNENNINKNYDSFKDQNKINSNNPTFEIEIKPHTKIITSKDLNYYYYLKNHQRKNISSFNDKNKFSFENSLRNYNPK